MKRSKQLSKESLEEFLAPGEYAAILAVVPKQNVVLICVKNPAALYGIKLKKEILLKKIKEIKADTTSLLFKIGEADG